MPGMPMAQANGIELYYETFGDDDGEPLLLVNGLGSQCISYEPDFCNAFVDRGFRVIRFDNRDVGMSTKIDTPHIDFANVLPKAMRGEPVEAPYLLSDMAADAVALLDHLGIESAHIVGMSMGGMIVQTIAIEYPERVRTMTTIMSTTGDRDVGGATPEAAGALLAPPATNRDEYIENYLEQWKVLSGPVYFDDTRFRTRGGAAYDRCYFPPGTGRQLLGIIASGSRTEGLRQLDVPTLVIHGRIDPLVTLSGGERTADVIPGAKLLLFDDMGHDLPPALWPQYVEAITNHASSARSVS
jgi:pimeloyl-ACP methyl ester carboxylesterase